MELAHQQVAAAVDDYMVFRVLPPVDVRIDAAAKAVCRTILAHAERTTDLLLCTPVDARTIPGRWSATLQEAGQRVQYELTQGPLEGLTLNLRAEDLGSGRTMLDVSGSYMAPIKPLLARRRAQQIAEALRAGLVRRLQDDLTTLAGMRIEQRATPRQALTLPVRLRLGDMPWPGVTRDVSTDGMGLLIPATPEEASAAAAQILTHSAGAVELLLGEGRLTSRVRIKRARPVATGIDVGLCFGMPEEGARLQRKLGDLKLWQTPEQAG